MGVINIPERLCGCGRGYPLNWKKGKHCHCRPERAGKDHYIGQDVKRPDQTHLRRYHCGRKEYEGVYHGADCQNKWAMCSRTRTIRFLTTPFTKETEYGLKRMKLPKEKRERRIMDAAVLTGMDKFLDQNPCDFPLSVRKFVTIASVIASGCEVLIF